MESRCRLRRFAREKFYKKKENRMNTTKVVKMSISWIFLKHFKTSGNV